MSHTRRSRRMSPRRDCAISSAIAAAHILGALRHIHDPLADVALGIDGATRMRDEGQRDGIAERSVGSSRLPLALELRGEIGGRDWTRCRARRQRQPLLTLRIEAESTAPTRPINLPQRRVRRRRRIELLLGDVDDVGRIEGTDQAVPARSVELSHRSAPIGGEWAVDEHVGGPLVTSDMRDAVHEDSRRGVRDILVRAADLPFPRDSNERIVQRPTNVPASTVARAVCADEEVDISSRGRGRRLGQ